MYAYTVSGEMTEDERERLILEHLPQVRLIARRIQARLPDSISIDDLVSTGVLGLISAIDHFDPVHNVKLKTYAEYKIRGAILDSLRGLDWAPRQKRRKSKQIEAAIAVAEQRLQCPPTEEDIAAELEITLDKYHEWLVEIRGLNLASLEYSGSDQGKDLLHYLPDTGEDLPSALLERAELEKLLASSIALIPEIEKTVLSLYYHEELTLREIAQVVNLHESRISQLKSQAILRLRSQLAVHAQDGRGMSAGGDHNQITEQIRGLLDHWAVGLADVVASMADQKPEVPWETAAEPPAEPDLLWWEQPFQIAPGAAVWVATPRTTWEYVGTLTLKAAGLDTVETNEARNTWLEILGQSLSGLARSIGGVLGREVTCEAGAESAPEIYPETAASLSLKFGDTPQSPLWIGFSPKLMDLIS